MKICFGRSFKDHKNLKILDFSVYFWTSFGIAALINNTGLIKIIAFIVICKIQ